MGKFRIQLEKQAIVDLAKITKSGRKIDLSKLKIIFEELKIDPRIGIGNPEKLKHQTFDIWSRRINSKDRLVYQIKDEQVIVLILSALGHYNDK